MEIQFLSQNPRKLIIITRKIILPMKSLKFFPREFTSLARGREDDGTGLWTLVFTW